MRAKFFLCVRGGRQVGHLLMIRTCFEELGKGRTFLFWFAFSLQWNRAFHCVWIETKFVVCIFICGLRVASNVIYCCDAMKCDAMAFFSVPEPGKGE